MGSSAAQEASSHSEYTCVLPQDAEVVQIVALAFAFESAFNAYQSTIRSPLLMKHLISGLASVGPEVYLKSGIDGRQVTNDERTFRVIFAHTVGRAVPAMLDLLKRDAALAPHLSSFHRPSSAFTQEMHRAAMHNLVTFQATPENEPLTLIWPLSTPEQEGGPHGSR